jgi:hypothetical protein
MMPVVTISRQYASGVAEIAPRVAEILDADLIDRQLIDEVGQRLGLPPDVVSEHDERGETAIARLVNALRVSYPDASSLPDLIEPPGAVPDLSNRAYVQVVEQIIQEAARSDNVVIVGRGSAFVLRNHPRAMHVHVFAPFDVRVENVMAEQKVNRQGAERIVRDFDGARARYARHFYHTDWQSPQHYHLLVNAGSIARDQVAELIVAAARMLYA